MTEILFYHLQNIALEKVLPPLLEKSLARGWRVVVQGSSDERIDVIDGYLWTYRDDSFLPHSTWRATDAAEQPILLTVDAANPNRAQVRFLVDNAPLPEDTAAYERIVVVFDGDNDDALAQARVTWKVTQASGYDVTYWQADEKGRWQRRGMTNTGAS